MKINLIFTTLFLCTIFACKEDRKVSCQYDVLGVYSGPGKEFLVQIPTGDSLTFEVVYNKGGVSLKSDGVVGEEVFEINDCTGNAGNYSITFYEDSLLFKDIPEVNNPAEYWWLEYYMKKQ